MVATEIFDPARSEAANPRYGQAVGVSTESAFFVLFVVGLAWVPFWIGSNRPIAWGINGCFFPGLAALYEFSLLIRGAPHPVPVRHIRLSAVLFAGAAVWAL